MILSGFILGVELAGMYLWLSAILSSNRSRAEYFPFLYSRSRAKSF
jgi:hypothetical protein